MFLEEGQIISIDCGVIKNDFYSDSARTLPVGRITRDKQKIKKDINIIFNLLIW